MDMDAAAPQSQLHIAMYPWFAIGHISPYIHLANKLAKRGHKISFFIPKKTKAKFDHQNLYPNLVTLIPITIPKVEGLPPDAETTLDLPTDDIPKSLLMTAMDRTEKDIELHLLNLKPNIFLFDLACWVPSLSRRLGIKSIQYIITSLLSAAYVEATEEQYKGKDLVGDELLQQPPIGFPDKNFKLHPHEGRTFASFLKLKFGGDVRLYDRMNTGRRLSDAVGFKGCREIEGVYADYLETLFKKPLLLLSGPTLPEPPTSTLEAKWVEWLGRLKPGSVVYCALGSEWTLQHDQFQELVLGLELTGFPFLAAMRPPFGFESVEEALPEGFKERVEGRGVVHGGWVQQTLILEHSSVGCFITHCGSGSLLEALLSKAQMVMLPNIFDQFLNARMLSSSFKAGVEVEKGGEDGLFTRESVCRAVKAVMDGESEVGREVRANHTKLRDLLLGKDLESAYLDGFCHKLRDLLG